MRDVNRIDVVLNEIKNIWKKISRPSLGPVDL